MAKKLISLFVHKMYHVRGTLSFHPLIHRLDYSPLWVQGKPLLRNMKKVIRRGWSFLCFFKMMGFFLGYVATPPAVVAVVSDIMFFGLLIP